MNSKESNVIIELEEALKNREITAVKTLSGDYLCTISFNGKNRMFHMSNKELDMELKLYWNSKYRKLLKKDDLFEIKELLGMEAYRNTLTYDLAKRIYNRDDREIRYDLNRNTGEYVRIQDGQCYLESGNDLVFRRNAFFKNQVEPDLSVPAAELIPLVEKHFNMVGKKDCQLIAIYIASCLWGLSISHPLLLFTGPKGSGKTTAMKMIEQIVDPKSIEPTGIPKGEDDMELRMNNTYFYFMDNVSKINRSRSDCMARAVTGGSVTKRALYTNTEEVVMNLKCLLAVTSVTMPVTESDLLDRSIIVKFRRPDAGARKTDGEIWEEFNQDLPRILGAAFHAVAEAMQDEECGIDKLTRMSDFHIVAVRIGKAAGLSEKEADQLIWRNQKQINKTTLDEDVVATLVTALVEQEKLYDEYIECSVSDLLVMLKQIEVENGMNPHDLPSRPNLLSHHLRTIQSNLEEERNIMFNIKNSGPFKKISLGVIKREAA